MTLADFLMSLSERRPDLFIPERADTAAWLKVLLEEAPTEVFQEFMDQINAEVARMKGRLN